MYSAPYGFPNAAAGSTAGVPFSSGAPSQSPHLQPGQSPGQPQMMYNPQQFPMAPQVSFPGGGPNPAALMAGAGPAGMMQNSAMPHMAANGQMAYQTPYTASAYGAGVPSPAGPQPQLAPNYMMATSMPPQFQANPAVMSQQQQQQQQHMMQRMHMAQQSAPAMSVSTPQRAFNTPQATPNKSLPSQQGQFTPPVNQQNTPQSQAPTPSQQQATTAPTPQTPTFPSSAQQANGNVNSTASTPLSPSNESRDKERFNLLLDINQELLYESIQLINTKNELKKEQATTGSTAEAPNGQAANYSEEEKLIVQDYSSCMRRLQGNLTYLAALADRKGAQLPPCPAYLSPPPLNLNLKMRSQPPVQPDSSEKQLDPNTDREERDKFIKEMYKKLQALFPGIDPKKEPAHQMTNARAAQAQQANQNGPRPTPAQAPNQGSPTPATSQAPRPAQTVQAANPAAY